VTSTHRVSHRSSCPFDRSSRTRPSELSTFWFDHQQQRINGAHFQAVALPQAVRHCANNRIQPFPRQASLLLSLVDSARDRFHTIEKTSRPLEVAGQHRQAGGDRQPSWTGQRQHGDACAGKPKPTTNLAILMAVPITSLACRVPSGQSGWWVTRGSRLAPFERLSELRL
jgi:hypothetical protein